MLSLNLKSIFFNMSGGLSLLGLAMHAWLSSSVGKSNKLHTVFLFTVSSINNLEFLVQRTSSMHNDKATSLDSAKLWAAGDDCFDIQLIGLVGCMSLFPQWTSSTASSDLSLRLNTLNHAASARLGKQSEVCRFSKYLKHAWWTSIPPRSVWKVNGRENPLHIQCRAFYLLNELLIRLVACMSCSAQGSYFHPHLRSVLTVMEPLQPKTIPFWKMSIAVAPLVYCDTWFFPHSPGQ